jgi:biopolymer transport protein ExbB
MMNSILSPFSALLAMPEPIQSIVNFFETGGLFMIPLVGCSIVAVTVVILRRTALKREGVIPPTVVREIERFSGGSDPEILGRMVGGDPSTLGKLVRVALENLRQPKMENIESVQIAARREMLKLESGLSILELIVGISPLLGLLGAVSGLVKVFSNLGTGKIGADTLGVALGIAEALNTTIFGLGIAIPTLIAYTYFHRKVETMSIELETLMADLVNKCYQQPATQRRSPGRRSDAEPVAVPSAARVRSSRAEAEVDPLDEMETSDVDR